MGKPNPQPQKKTTVTPEAAAASINALWLRMAQFVAMFNYTLPPATERQMVRITITDRKVRNRVGKFSNHRVGVADDGTIYMLPAQLLRHMPMVGCVYDAIAFMDPVARDMVAFPFSGAGLDVVEEYNRTHQRNIIGDGKEPMWRVLNGRPLRAVIMEPRITTIGDGKKKRAGAVWGTFKSAILTLVSSDAFDGPSVVEVSGESRNALYVTYIGPYVQGMDLNRTSGKATQVAGAQVPNVPLGKELLRAEITEIDPDGIVSFWRSWNSQRWEDHSFRTAAKAAGVEVPEDHVEGKSLSVLWCAERGQPALTDALQELDTELWDTINSTHTASEAKEALGVNDDMASEEALALVNALRGNAEVGEDDPIITWFKNQGVSWANPKAPIAMKARNRVFGRLVGALRRPKARIEVSLNKKTKIQGVDAWGLLRPSGRDAEAMDRAAAEGTKEVETAEGIAGSERVTYLNKVIVAAGHPPLDLTQGVDKARFIACLNAAARVIKEAIKPKAEAPKAEAAAALDAPDNASGTTEQASTSETAS